MRYSNKAAFKQRLKKSKNRSWIVVYFDVVLVRLLRIGLLGLRHLVWIKTGELSFYDGVFRQAIWFEYRRGNKKTALSIVYFHLFYWSDVSRVYKAVASILRAARDSIW